MIKSISKMEVKEKIFDSDIHDWSEKTSEFNQKILNKSRLIFLIEDSENNLFGG